MNAVSFRSPLQKARGLPRKLSRWLLPQPADFEENNDIRTSSKKKLKKNAGVRSADVRCRSWWGVADERIYFWVRQYRGDALTLNGATCNIYKCLMIFMKKNKTLHFWWSSYTLFLRVIPFITHWFITACVENSHCYDFSNNANFQMVFPGSCWEAS